MRVLRDAHMPTHVLAATQSDQDIDAAPMMLPIDRTLFERGFRIDLSIPSATPGSTAPIPRSLTVGDAQILVVNLPVVTVRVPHLPSFALLLLFGMGLETNTNLLSWKLLPVNVVEEFPNASAMSLILSRAPQDTFDTVYRHNQGLWKNTLAMGLTNNRIVQVVQTAWNVSAESRRVRLRTNLFS